MNIVTSPRAAEPRSAAFPRSISVLGATGSIGQSTLDLVRRDRARFQIEALTALKQAEPLAAIAREFGAKFAAIADESQYPVLKTALSGTGIEIAAGEEALVEAARRPADWVMAAITGAAGLRPTLAAAERGAMVAIANKECLVCAGELFMARAAACGATVLPVDSEHNALYQAMTAGRRSEVHRVIITASGGPFREWPLERIRAAKLEEALKHPNWSMGQKITIDSATMMNKGLEVIEAHHLFGLTPDEIEVVVHPQSIIHSLVEYIDGSQIAQLGPPDMRVPIAYCIAWPERIHGPIQRLSLGEIGRLTFEEPDLVRFPALRLARESLVKGGSAPTVLNAANEIAVAAFLDRKLGFAGIPALVEATLEAAEARNAPDRIASCEDALAVDHIGRSLARDLLPRIAAMLP